MPGLPDSLRPRAMPVAEEVTPVRPGEVIALVGHSGAGKSTVVDLIPRFYDVNGGRITVDGIDIRGVTLNSLRRHPTSNRSPAENAR